MKVLINVMIFLTFLAVSVMILQKSRLAHSDTIMITDITPSANTITPSSNNYMIMSNICLEVKALRDDVEILKEKMDRIQINSLQNNINVQPVIILDGSKQ
jgi:hypothetical protein